MNFTLYLHKMKNIQKEISEFDSLYFQSLDYYVIFFEKPWIESTCYCSALLLVQLFCNIFVIINVCAYIYHSKILVSTNQNKFTK